MHSENNSIDDVRWLVSDEAKPLLAATQERLFAKGNEAVDTLKVLKGLRKKISTPRANLVLQQAQLRQKARKKFDLADQMFFTETSLQQSSGQLMASFKADRFSSFSSIADLCCGMGGDAIELRRSMNAGNLYAVDQDLELLIYCQANLDACPSSSAVSCHSTKADINQFDLGEVEAWHLDPDQRVEGRRLRRSLDHCSPNAEQIQALVEKNPNGCVKLSPACEIPADWFSENFCTVEYLGDARECKQLLICFGDLKQAESMSARIVRGSNVDSFSGDADVVESECQNIGEYLFEPHSTLLASKLVDDFAQQHQLERVKHGVGYLTGDQTVESPFVASFRVLESSTIDTKRIRSILNSKNYVITEVKKRGVDQAAYNACLSLLKKASRPSDLTEPGSGESNRNDVTLILTQMREGAVALFTERLN